MSVPFTIGTVGGSWQEKAEELRRAFCERYFVGQFSWWRYGWNGSAWAWTLTGDGTDADKLPEGANIQSVAFWYGMQQKTSELICRHVSIPGHDYTGETNKACFDQYSLGGTGWPLAWKEFCRWAGGTLWASETDYGWPRLTKNDELARGPMVEGDVITPTLIQAFVEVFSHMTHMESGWIPVWTGMSGYSGIRYGGATSRNGGTRESAWADTVGQPEGVESWRIYAPPLEPRGNESFFFKTQVVHNEIEQFLPPGTLWLFTLRQHYAGKQCHLDLSRIPVISWDFYLEHWSDLGGAGAIAELTAGLFPVSYSGEHILERVYAGLAPDAQTPLMGATWFDQLPTPYGIMAMDYHKSGNVTSNPIMHFDFTNATPLEDL